MRDISSYGVPQRLLTVTATNLVRSEFVTEQLDLFDTGSEKKRERVKKGTNGRRN